MVRRLLLGAALMLVAACGTASMDADDVSASAARALADAGLRADQLDVEAAGPDTWEVIAELDDGMVTLVMDGSGGRFTTIDVGEDVTLDDAELETLAAHTENPADQAARRRRAVVASVLIVAAVVGGLALARRARLREEADAMSRPR